MNDDPEPSGRNTRRRNAEGNVEFKIRSIFLPYLAIATGLPLFYSALHWLLIVSTDVPPLDDDLTNFILPLCLPWLIILPWFRHRIKLLKWPKQNDASLGYFLAWVCLAAPTVIAQHYLEKAAGELTILERVSQIGSKPHTKYYKVRDLILDKAHARRWIRTSTSGRNSENWNINVYYAIPLLDHAARFEPMQSTAWLGVPYVRQLSSRLSPEERRAQLTAFASQSEHQLNNDDFRWISYLATVGKNKDRQALEAALESGAAYRVMAPSAILEGHAEPFESRTGNTLSWALGVYGAGVGLWLLLALTMKINASQRRQWAEDGPPSNDDLIAELAIIRPRADFFATPILLDLNILVWVAMLVCGLGIDSISAADLMGWGAFHASNVQDGEVWRLLTSLFVHAGILHFANNMVSLVLLGLLLESAFGSRWFITVYLLSGIAGSLGSMIWNPNLVGVGASGCIFGVAGFGLALLLLKRRRFASERPMLLKLAGAYLGINLVLGAILPGIDLVAHLAGLGFGGLLGVIASPKISDAPARH